MQTKADLVEEKRESAPRRGSAEKSQSLRQQYLQEKQQIIEQIGDLNSIRIGLGLSQRRLCQILMVDPSAWTRWMKSDAPPIVYKALAWLVELKRLNPDAALPSDFAGRLSTLHSSTQIKIQEIESILTELKAAVASGPRSLADALRAHQGLAMESALKNQEVRLQEQIQMLKAELEGLKSIRRQKVKKKPKGSIKKQAKKKVKLENKANLKKNAKRKKNAMGKKVTLKKTSKQKTVNKNGSKKSRAANRTQKSKNRSSRKKK